MLKKINRGLKRKDFGSVLGEGKTIQTPLFGVRYETLPAFGHLPLTGQVAQSQVGWIISKKISKKAVDRNKIKRRLSEVIKKNLPNNLKLVILVKKNILEAKVAEINKCWEMVYEKIGTKNTSAL